MQEQQQQGLDFCQSIYDLYMPLDGRVAKFMSAVVTHTKQQSGCGPTRLVINRSRPDIVVEWDAHNVLCQVTDNNDVVVRYQPDALSLQYSLRDGTLAANVAEQIVVCIEKEKALYKALYV
jgi:hypothetical protein